MTEVVRFAVVEGCVVVGGVRGAVALVVGGCLAVETPVVTRVVGLAVPIVVCRSVGLTDVVSLPGAVVPSLVFVVDVASPVGFSVLWPPGRVNKNMMFHSCLLLGERKLPEGGLPYKMNGVPVVSLRGS